jgi:hypothetical protein
MLVKKCYQTVTNACLMVLPSGNIKIIKAEMSCGSESTALTSG